MTHDELQAWISDLRGRLERGELAEVGPVILVEGYRARDAEETAQDLLEQVDIWRARPAAARRTPIAVDEQRYLARQLEALYERVVEGKPMPEPAKWPLGRPADG